MRVTLLGHASIVVEAGGARLLMDPVFVDPFEHGLATSCPARVVHSEAFGPIDAVFLSHGHADHFDAGSLARLPRTTPVFGPGDGADGQGLRRALAALGFADFRSLRAGDWAEVGGLRCLATGSLEPDELGAVFVGDDVSLWNLVDTAANQTMVGEILRRLGRRLDAVICPYNPLLEYGEVWLSETEFPVERYERLIEAALSTQARVVIPGSSGQRLIGKREWLNRRIFPVSRERFLADLAAIAPEVAGVRLEPGQGVVLEAGAPPRVESTPFATQVHDDTHLIDFAPEKAPEPPLVDDNPFGLPAAEIDSTLRELQRRLQGRFEELLTPRLAGPLRTLWDRRARLQIDFATPKGMESLHLQRWVPRPRWVTGPAEDPDYRFAYVASELCGFFLGQLEAWDVTLRAWRRRTALPAGQPFRLSALDPARLHGEDLYFIVDEDFPWHPLSVLLTHR